MYIYIYMHKSKYICSLYIYVYIYIYIYIRARGAERRILVPGCDGVGGSAGEARLSVCVFVCCLRVCSGWVAACWLFLVLSK